MLSLLTSTPRFSGFYELKANDSQFDTLPIAKEKSRRFAYGSTSDSGYQWMYVSPDQDKKLEASLKEHGIEFSYLGQDEVIKAFTLPGEALPQETPGNQPLDPIFLTLLSRLFSTRMSQLMHNALKNAFDSAFGSGAAQD